MSSSYSFEIDKPRHRSRCRARLEGYADPGPQLPPLPVHDQPRPPRSRRGHRGETLVWCAGAGAWIGID